MKRIRAGGRVTDDDEIFTVKARRCKRCGGLLTSKQAVADGYGHVCKMKALYGEEINKPMSGQMDLFSGEISTSNESED